MGCQPSFGLIIGFQEKLAKICDHKNSPNVLIKWLQFMITQIFFRSNITGSGPAMANMWQLKLQARRQNLQKWSLTDNSIFTIKSLYGFLIDRGMSYVIAPKILKDLYSQKILLFNWLTQKNKILTLENIAFRKCNKLRTSTCVICHAELESIDLLFIHCDPLTNQFDLILTRSLIHHV